MYYFVILKERSCLMYRRSLASRPADVVVNDV